MQQVLDDHAVDDHQVVSEETAVASPPHRLRAHDRNALFLGPVEQLVHAGGELGAGHVVGVPAGASGYLGAAGDHPTPATMSELSPWTAREAFE